MAGKQRRTVRTDRARENFIATLAQFCNVSEAARAAGIARSTAYEWREDDAEFAALWDEAEQAAADKLEREAWRRAVEGVDKPIYYQGDKIDTCKEYSDRMLEILLKGHRPEKFVDRIKAEHSGSVPVTFNFIRQADAPDAD
jgi:hypothetical protein